MKNLVIGNKGQIGSAIQSILGCHGIDKSENVFLSNTETEHYDVLHICIPYSDEFIDLVHRYKLWYDAEIVIVHSTVPVGTCAKIGEFIVYSPCRGIHPELEKGIRTFTKYFAGEKAEQASKVFSEKGLDCVYATNPIAVRSLEASKLWDTTQYGWNIIIEKMIYKHCQDNDLDFNLVYTMFNKSYNEGYEKLGHPEYKKYILEHRDGKIGGHCVMANLDLLDSKICDIIKELNN